MTSRDTGSAKRTPMSWADTVKETALAALAGRTATTTRSVVDAPWNWNPHDLWLARTSQPRELVAQPSVSDPSSPPHHDTALRG